MFFEEESINQKLQCRICHKRFQDPVLLPCIEFVCEQCITDFIEDHSVKDQFKCCICDEEHSIPANGFPKSKQMSLLLDVKPKKVNRGIFVEQFETDINKCLESINQIKSSLQEKETIIRDHFEQLRHRIQLTTESKIEEINKKSNELISRIDRFEAEYLKKLIENQQQKAIENELKEAEEFCSEWLRRIKLAETSADEVTVERPNLDNILDKIQKTSLDKNSYIYNFKQVNFVENETNIESSLIGEINLRQINVKRSESDITVRELSEISKTLITCNHALLEMNLYSNGKLFLSSLSKYDRKTEKSDSRLSLDVFSTPETDDGVVLHNKTLPYDPSVIEKSIKDSISFGRFVLFSLHLSDLNKLVLYLVSNSFSDYEETIFELELSDINNFKLSIDYKNVYLFNQATNTLDFYDLTLWKRKSVDISQDMKYLFDKNVSIKVDNKVLYACTKDTIDTFQLSDMKLIKSRILPLQYDHVSKHLVKNFCILRFHDHISFYHLKHGSFSKRTVNDLDLKDSNLEMRTLDGRKLVFFNRSSKKCFISA